MQGPIRNAGFQLCQQAAVEQDPVKMIELITQMNDFLEEKENRLLAEQKPTHSRVNEPRKV
jgi:hypothetical protein